MKIIDLIKSALSKEEIIKRHCIKDFGYCMPLTCVDCECCFNKEV